MAKLTEIRKQALDEMMKEALFEATVAVLSEHGVEGMTMDRVALAAGVAKGSIYNYFGSKKELLEFVYTKAVDPIVQDLAETVMTDQSAMEKLGTHLEKMLEHFARHAKVFQMLFEDEAAQGLLHSSKRIIHEAGSQRLASVFRQGIEEGVFCDADPLMMANMYYGLCRGVFESHPRLEGVEDREKIHGLIMGIFLNGIGLEQERVG